ncbi:MAG: ribosomal-processing cysteine protease Prp [Lachnospiraceae bacterium]|jgi:uncharacterized protein YsxB (DUF464 family)|nr:ribosomal-processing cysteine protease Prp [Lachnospiraceae bacterium]
MITARLFQNSVNQYYGFLIEGHAGYGEEGEDIICSAVSALALNTVNSIEKFTAFQPFCKIQDGYLSCTVSELQFPNSASDIDFKDVSLLLNSLALGLESIVQTYGTQYLHVLITQK